MQIFLNGVRETNEQFLYRVAKHWRTVVKVNTWISFTPEVSVIIF